MEHQKSYEYSLTVCGHPLNTGQLQGEGWQTAERSGAQVLSASSLKERISSLFILSRRRRDLSPVGYSAVSVIITRHIIGTPEAKSPLELTDHHLHAVWSSLRTPPFRYSIYLCDTQLQEAFFQLILPMKFPISPAHSADTGIESLPYIHVILITSFRAIAHFTLSWELKHNYALFRDDSEKINYSRF